MIYNLEMTLRPVDDPNHRGIPTAAKCQRRSEIGCSVPDLGMMTACECESVQ